MREKSDFAANKNPAIHSGGMTGLVELSLCREISLFQSYLLHPDNVDAAESFRSSSIASIMVPQEPWPPKFRQRYNRYARFIASANEATMIAAATRGTRLG